MRPNGCSGKLCPMQVGTADNCGLTKEQCPYFTQDIDYKKVLETIKHMAAATVLLELKKQIHDKATYPHGSGIDPYISLKVVDAILQGYLNKFE